MDKDLELLREALTRIEKRVLKVEDWRDTQSINLAVAIDRYERIEKKLEGIESHLSNFVRVVIGGIVAAVIAFIFKGGMAI